MATTHVFVGLVLAGAVALVAPDVGTAAAIGAVLGGLFPDVDVVATHRWTLHYPVYYWPVAGLSSVLAVARPSAVTVALATFFLAAACHSLSDALGGSHELEPWTGRRDRAVYSHYHGRWLAARRWIAYDGSPGDLALAAVLAVPSLLVFDPAVRRLVVASLVVSIGYAVLRRPIAALLERLLGSGSVPR
ncbi:metal-dependent hydrolase [Halopiger goleimassiliensis]|uniref:metal-dependent hydrolase n=1 Tax=Halopiger goleimassiliensis TaxID=1293048 RepID=UPI001E32D665|nr:metal-dependent hydrolase [Halopiger goleimassiliensis]